MYNLLVTVHCYENKILLNTDKKPFFILVLLLVNKLFMKLTLISLISNLIGLKGKLNRALFDEFESLEICHIFSRLGVAKAVL